jgi:hypothetical protein
MIITISKAIRWGAIDVGGPVAIALDVQFAFDWML